MAIDCLYRATFCEAITAEDGSIHSSILIVHGKVMKKTRVYLKVEVIDILHSSLSTENLVIHEDNSIFGQQYTESISNYQVGFTYIFAVALNGSGEYNLLTCGVTGLSVENQEIIGPIAPGIERMDYQTFAGITGCGGLGFALTSFHVQPTLAHGEIFVISLNDETDVNITMYDMVGRILFRENVDIVRGEPLSISTNSFPSGCYTLVCVTGGYQKTTRIILT